MSDSNLPESVVEALARLHSALPHNAALESDFFFLRAELVKNAISLRGHEKTIRRLESEQLKSEEVILYQADRILVQHQATIRREQAHASLYAKHMRLLADHNQMTVRNLLARIMGRRREQM